MGSIGSNMTNAFTSFENTNLYGKHSFNNLERFLKVQSERFRMPVFRLFHTELEAVYEERTLVWIMAAIKFWNLFASLFKNIHTEHKPPLVRLSIWRILLARHQKLL